MSDKKINSPLSSSNFFTEEEALEQIRSVCKEGVGYGQIVLEIKAGRIDKILTLNSYKKNSSKTTSRSIDDGR